MNTTGHEHQHTTGSTTPHKKEGMMDKIHDKAHDLKEKIMPSKHHEAGHTTTHGTGHTTTGHGVTSSHDTTGHTGHGMTSGHNTMGHTSRAHGSSSSSSSSSSEGDYYHSPTRGRVKKPGLAEKVKNKVHRTKDKMTGKTHHEGGMAHPQTHPSKLHGDKLHPTHHEGHVAENHAYSTDIRP